MDFTFKTWTEAKNFFSCIPYGMLQEEFHRHFDIPSRPGFSRQRAKRGWATAKIILILIVIFAVVVLAVLLLLLIITAIIKSILQDN